jgi:hypothetical protein
MQAKSAHILLCLFAILLAVALPSCGGGGGGGITTTTPTYITASWSGGATGEPTDRTDVEATEFTGLMCPANAIDLQNYINNFNGLTIINNCSISVTLAMCVAKGSLPQPENGLSQCATDPFDTPATDLKYHTITAGPGAEDYRNATEELSLAVFFCSDSQTICAPPICDQVSCL